MQFTANRVWLLHPVQNLQTKGRAHPVKELGFVKPEHQRRLIFFPISRFICRTTDVVIDADEVKKGFIPEYNAVNKAADSGAWQTHEESSHIAKTALKKALDEGYDAIYDATLKNTNKAIKTIENVKQKGYNVNLRGMFIPVEEAVHRSNERYKHTGRKVPEKIIRDAHIGFSKTFPIITKLLNFQEGDHAELYSNEVPEGSDPILVYKDGKIINKTEWEKFLSIGSSNGN